jgi:hypothetical protein
MKKQDAGKDVTLDELIKGLECDRETIRRAKLGKRYINESEVINMVGGAIYWARMIERAKKYDGSPQAHALEAFCPEERLEEYMDEINRYIMKAVVKQNHQAVWKIADAVKRYAEAEEYPAEPDALAAMEFLDKVDHKPTSRGKSATGSSNAPSGPLLARASLKR